MNYKVRAYDLVNQFYIALVPGLDTKIYQTNEDRMQVCKHCALIAINTLIDEDTNGNHIYWQLVKNEINKM